MLMNMNNPLSGTSPISSTPKKSSPYSSPEDAHQEVDSSMHNSNGYHSSSGYLTASPMKSPRAPVKEDDSESELVICSQSPTLDEVTVGASQIDPGPRLVDQTASQNTAYRETSIAPIDQETDKVKAKLIDALAKAIPHDHKLAVKLMINFSIDDGQTSRCIVIDETVHRGSKTNHTNCRRLDDGVAVEPEVACKRTKIISSSAMDLSLGGHASPPSGGRNGAEQGRATAGPANVPDADTVDGIANQQQILDLLACIKQLEEQPMAGRQQTSPPVEAGLRASVSLPVVMPEAARPAVSTSNVVPAFVNTSNMVNIWRLMKNPTDPVGQDRSLLIQGQPKQNQTQQQQQQQQLYQQIQLMNQLKLPLVPDQTATSATATSDPSSDAVKLLKKITSLLQDQASGNANVTSNLTAAAAAAAAAATVKPLIDQPPDLGRSINQNIVPTSFSLLANSGSSVNPFAALLPTSQVLAPATSATGTGTTSTKDNSFISLQPLFNPFTPEQLSALTSAAVAAAGLNSSPLTIPSLTIPHQHQTSLANSSSVSAALPTASFSLLNFKDKHTGLETLGIMPVSKAATSTCLLSSYPSISSPKLAAGASPARPFPQILTKPMPQSMLPLQHTGSPIPVNGGDQAIRPPDLNADSPSTSTPTSSSTGLAFGRRLATTRRFICNQCRTTFASLADLNRHTLDNHNSFKCTICSAHFTQRSNLQRHSLKHVGFKPFTCNLCRKEYYRKDHLVRHIEVTHPNHDPKANITVHLTSSECLDYLDRLNAGKSPNPSLTGELPASIALAVSQRDHTEAGGTNGHTDESMLDVSPKQEDD